VQRCQHLRDCAPPRAHRRRVPAAPRRRRQDRLWPVILGTLGYLIALAIVVVAWWSGKALTPELLAMLAAFIGFVARTDGAMLQRLWGHDAAISAIAAHRGIPAERVRSIYDVVEEEAARTEAEARRRKKTT